MTIIKRLTNDNYGYVLNTAQDGQSALTHKARITDETGKERDAYVKIYPTNYNKALLNETIGYLLSHSLGIKQPSNAYLLPLSIHRIKEIYGPKVLENYPHNYFPVWITTEIPGNTVKYFYKRMNTFIMKDFKSWDSLPHCIVMDDITAHTDRNLGNFVRIKKKEYATIDYGGLTTGPNWEIEDLTVEVDYLNKLITYLFNDEITLPFKNRLLQVSLDHRQSFDKVRSEIYFWMNFYLPDFSVRYNYAKFVAYRHRIAASIIKKKYEILL